MSNTWESLIAWDLSVIHSVLRFMYNPKNSWVREKVRIDIPGDSGTTTFYTPSLLCRRPSPLPSQVDELISPNAYNDINIVTWLIFFVVMGLNAYTNRWYAFLWCSSLNLLASALLRVLFQARRPFEIDRRLRPLTNKTRQSYGFPSIESHMAVVVNGYVAARFAEWWVSIPLFFLTLFVGFTRVYSCARFVHQVLLSYGTGVIGLIIFFKVENRLEKVTVNWQLHYVYLAICTFFLLAFLSLAVEDNSSNIAGIPREEYIRVVGGILSTDTAQIHEHMHAQGEIVRVAMRHKD